MKPILIEVEDLEERLAAVEKESKMRSWGDE
jgi:hypothetical protein